MDQPGGGENSVWENSFSTYQKAMSMSTAPHFLKIRVQWTLGIARFCDWIPEGILSRTIPILAQTLSNDFDALTDNKPILIVSIHCLTRMAHIGDGRLADEIGHSGAIGHLMRLSYWAMFHSEDNGFFMKLILKCYAVLVSISHECRVDLYKENGAWVIPMFFRSDRSNMECTRPYLLEIISAMSMYKEFRKRIIDVQGHRHLFDAVASTGSSMACRVRACQAMALIGVDKEERLFFGRLGAIPVLVNLLRNVNGRTKLVVANALGVIASQIDHIKETAGAGAIPLYAELLQGPDPVGREIAEDMLCLLTVDKRSVVSIAEYAGRILSDGHGEAKFSAADVFWNIAAHNHFEPIVRNSGALPFLLELLRDGNLEMKRKVSSMIVALSYNKAERDGLVEIGAIPIIDKSGYDEDDMYEMYENAVEALVQIYADPDHTDKVAELIHSCFMEDMLEQYDQIYQGSVDDTRRSLWQMRTLLSGPEFV